MKHRRDVNALWRNDRVLGACPLDTESFPPQRLHHGRVELEPVNVSPVETAGGHRAQVPPGSAADIQERARPCVRVRENFAELARVELRFAPARNRVDPCFVVVRVVMPRIDDIECRHGRARIEPHVRAPFALHERPLVSAGAQLIVIAPRNGNARRRVTDDAGIDSLRWNQRRMLELGRNGNVGH
jgi:hypothetical protein